MPHPFAPRTFDTLKKDAKRWLAALAAGDGGQPAFGVLLQRCEGTAGERMRHDTFLHVPDVR